MAQLPPSDNPFSDEPPPTNPYAAPAPIERPFSIESVRNRLTSPAIALIVISSLSILFHAGNFVFRTLVDVARMDQGFSPATAGYVVGMLLGPFCNLITILGAVEMLRMRHYGNAMTGAVLACIPFCSSCVFFGIPFGIWAVVVLRQADTIAAFQTLAAARQK